MTSSASGPYQSKFFNFLNRQSLKWRDHLETTARHLKVTVEWGLQILLYPAYLLVQTGRMAGRELKQVTTRAQLSAVPAEGTSPTTTSDRPITQVLSALPLSQENEPAIQGITSLLDSHRLALVTRENSLLDVLSPEQQKTLLACIRREVANYHYERRLAEAEKPKLPGAIPSFEGEANKILPPARWFWQVMRWVQQSPVAIAANLFGEGAFHVDKSPSTERNISPETASNRQPSNPKFPIPNIKWDTLFGESRLRVGSESTVQLHVLSLSPNSAFVAKLDHQIAQWEIAPLATAKQLLQKIQTLSPQQLQPLIAKTHSAPPANPQNPLETTAPFSLQALILAAVDYFFGGRSQQAEIGGEQTVAKRLRGQGNRLLSRLLTGESGANNRRQLPPGSETVADTEDPWLCWEELFTDLSAPVSETAASLATEHPASLPSGLPVPKQEEMSRWESRRQNLRRSRGGKLRHSPTKVTNHLTKQEAAGLPTHTPLSPTEIVPARQEPDAVETAFDWLEATVTSTGYVKHPLEQILAWLDRLVLWLEQLLAYLLKKIHSR